MRAREILLLMARAALLRSDPVTVGTAPNVHGVLMTVVSLPWEVASRMAIHAPRVSQDRDKGGEQSSISSRWCCSNCRHSGRGFRRADPARARHRSYQDQNRGTDSEDWQPE
jgi:hypothetical protein